MSGDGRRDGTTGCPACGASAPDGARWCGRCGSPLTADDDGDGGQPVVMAPPGTVSGTGGDRSTGRSRSRVRWWVSALVVLAGISIVVTASVSDRGPRTVDASTASGPTDGSGTTAARLRGPLGEPQVLRPTERQTPTFVRAAMVIGDTAVVDISGGVAGFREGRLAWQLPVDGVLGHVAGGIRHERLVVAAGQELLELDPIDGSVVHRASLEGAATARPHVAVAVGDLAIIADHPGLRVVEIASGRTRWQLRQMDRGLAGVTSRHVVLADRGRFSALDIATGETVSEWGERTVGYGPPSRYRHTTAVGDLFIQETDNGRLEAVDPEDGGTVWSFEAPGAVSSVVGPSPDGSLVVLIRGDGAGPTALLLDRGGEEVRRWHLGGSVFPVAVTERGLVVSSPSRIALHPFEGPEGASWISERGAPHEHHGAAAAAGAVFVPGPNGITVLDERDGRRIGRLPGMVANSRVPGVAVDGMVITPGSRTEAWDLRDREVRWAVRGSDEVVAMPPDGLVLIDRAHGPDEPGTVRGIDPASGATRWEIDVDVAGPSMALPVAGGLLLDERTAAEGSVETTRLALRDAGSGRVLGQLQLDAFAHMWLARGDADGAAIVAQHPPGGQQQLMLVAAEVHEEGVVELSTAWTAELPEALGDVALTRDAVLVRGAASLVSLDRRDGAVRWRIQTDRPTNGGLVVQDGHVAIRVGVDEIRVHRLSDGGESWRYEHDVPILTPAVGAGGALHAIDQERRVLAVSAGHAEVVGALPEDSVPLGTPLVTPDGLVVVTTEGLVVLGT